MALLQGTAHMYWEVML